ncbi:DNA-protecting protein DprA [Roseospira marina]|uniref:DNA-protecting protein DprA n=1 Tax=Roseospira marina TaxID=140057 RepID=A0A5M6ICE6_9PROT|nr:DNA-processing protein DprA [Roseospira marina]KAA5605415.1 DNA-protecting protein DprA [Roseospira marina]MBB4314593.1 DNA processing protein [Roseospira marina]MBB5088845.1 DNA processing protein [Roseospira marina]
MSSIVSNETYRILKLSVTPGVGAACLRKISLFAQKNGIESLYNDRDVYKFLPSRIEAYNAESSSTSADKILVSCDENNVRLISFLDPLYPAALKSVPDFPVLLYIKGDAAALSKVGCAVVGTRHASKLGLSWARQIASLLVKNGFCVVSGLALGIDTAAHEGALQAGGATVAVMAHGLDKVTPARNKNLSTQIIENGGALVSEHAPGVPPRKQEYVRRNRIQSGLSICSLVVESSESGGSIYQGKFTLQQNRKLFCIMPPENTRGVSDFQAAGARRLIREAGAKPIGSSEELLSAINSAEITNSMN